MLLSALLLSACSGTEETIAPATEATASLETASDATATATLVGPTAESRIYKLIPNYNSGHTFEASGVVAVGSYFYVVCDNRTSILKLYNTLPINSSLNTVIGSSGTSTSNYEAITYDSNGTPNFFVTIENESHNGAYSPKVREYTSSLSYQNNMWADYSFSSSNQNKGFEGNAWVYRGGDDYLLGLCEGTGNIIVTKKTGSNWQYIATIAPPVSFTDYSDIAIQNNKVLISSQEDSQLWVGDLSSTTWAFVGAGKVYNFPRGSSTGVVGAGTNKIYANIEGVYWIDSNTIVAVSDKAGSSDPAYTKYKDQSVHIFKLQ